MTQNIAQYTEAGRYVRLLRSCAGQQWEDVQKEVQQLGEALKQYKDYVRWAERSAERWQSLTATCQQPLVQKLVQFLLSQKRIMFLIDLAEALAERHTYATVLYAGDKPPAKMDDIQQFVATLWGAHLPIRISQQKDLIDGISLTYGQQTYDMSYRHYRHNLIAHLRRTTSLEN